MQMKIVLAPDSFKGSMSAKQLCEVWKEAIVSIAPQAQVISFPMTDGGEGFIENMVFATEGTMATATVTDPLGRTIEASYGVLGDGKTVVIDTAQASGLTLLSEDERNPFIASSYGTGMLIMHALDHGYRHFLIGLGGSATNDAGAGLLRALGICWLDQDGRELQDGGEALQSLAVIDDTLWDERLNNCTFTVACDVDNRLCGPEGASYTFAPQKGASRDQVVILDQALNHFADVVTMKTGRDPRSIEGGGAAGGIAAALAVFCNAQLVRGVDLVMEQLQIEQHLRGADLLITGEGKLDQQTLHGKVIAGLSRKAATYRVPVVALAGSVSISPEEARSLGLAACFSFMPGPVTLSEAIEHVGRWSQLQIINIIQLWLTAKWNKDHR